MTKKSRLLNKLQHENILRFLDWVRTEKNVYIFFEFSNGGDLKRFLNLRGGYLEEELAAIILKQVAIGLKYLSENKVMHRDIKLENILMHFPNYKGKGSCPDEYIMNFDYEKEPIEVTICDLGFSKEYQQERPGQTFWGTPQNMAPEIILSEEYDTMIDVWAFGIVMYELLVGIPPFNAKNQLKLAWKIINEGTYRIPRATMLSKEGVQLLTSCLKFNLK